MPGANLPMRHSETELAVRLARCACGCAPARVRTDPNCIFITFNCGTQIRFPTHNKPLLYRNGEAADE